MTTREIRSRAAHVVKLAEASGKTIATVESCTAGALAHLLSEPEGASHTLHGGFIVYTKENKTAAVGVPKDLLADHTAVSGEVAKAMAEGGLSRCPADIVVAITGVAGPEPDEDGNPVGRIYLAAAERNGRTIVEHHEFGNPGKDKICCESLDAALALLEKALVAHAP